MPTLDDLHREFDGPIPQQLLDAARRGPGLPEPGDDDADANEGRAAHEMLCARVCIRRLTDIRRRPHPTVGDRCRAEGYRRDLRRHLENWAARLRIAASIRRRLSRPVFQMAAE